MSITDSLKSTKDILDLVNSQTDPSNIYKYEKAFNDFKDFCAKRKLSNLTKYETVLTFIVNEIEEKRKAPTTVNSELSMIKNFMSKKLDMKIENIEKIYDFLNVKISEFKKKSSNFFRRRYRFFI
jgi:site-specific recombinase XerD